MNHPCHRTLLAYGTATLVLLGSTPAFAQTTRLVSASNAGQISNLSGTNPGLSGDGRSVVFLDSSSNLVSGDTNGKADIFLKDTQTGAIVRLSVSNTGAQSDADSNNPHITANGRYVVFDSKATNLITGDTNLKRDCFLLDRQIGTLQRVSLGNNGAQGNGDSLLPFVSEDGRAVTFCSNATNLTSAGGNGKFAVYVRDLQLQTTVCVSNGTGGGVANGNSFAQGITPDGRFVTFSSIATNLVPNDTNGQEDAFLYDRTLLSLERVSVATNGAGGDGTSGSDGVFASSDGRYVYFGSTSSNLDPLSSAEFNLCYLRDRATQTTRLVSLGARGETPDSDLYPSSLSPDARLIAFDGFASNLVPNDTPETPDAFLRDLLTGRNYLLSATTAGTPGGGESALPVISANGKFAAFRSSSASLVSGVTDNTPRIYVRGALFSTVSGTLNFGTPTSAPQDFRFTVRSGSTDLYTLTQPVSPNGNFSLLVEAGDLTLHLKSSRTLGKNVSLDTRNGDVALGAIGVKLGDINGDNAVDFGDLSAMLQVYNALIDNPLYATNPLADLNLDGGIDFGDLSALLQNYNAFGDD
ncbi:MAG: PD40 domain-containing protein [Chthonomonadaceae bacterium]|nr:PD40 domain-containing protein [Chthonomonadaceae bacterium]